MSSQGYWATTALSSAVDTWATPRDFYAGLHWEFGFTLDAAALACSALCPEWYGPDHPDEDRRDCLTQSWSTEGAVWLNPPYGRSIGSFMQKADTEAKAGATVVCLVPARTDTAWFQDYCLHHEVRYIRGRLKFGTAPNPAPFPSAVVVMRPPER